MIFRSPAQPRTTPLAPGRRRAVALLVSSALVLGACSSSNDDDGDLADGNPGDTGGTEDGGDTGNGGSGFGTTERNVAAYVATAASDFSAGRVDRLVFDDEGFVIDGNYPATVSDLRVGTVDGDMIEVARFGTSTLARYSAIDTSTPIWEFSVNGDDADGNPQDVVFDEFGFGYVPRYGGTDLFVIDPEVAADDEAGFVETTFDLSTYSDSGEVPNMTDAVIVDGELFVLMERLQNGFDPTRVGYVAVFDLATGQQIDTEQGGDGLFGIELDVVNPTALQFDATSGLLYVLGRGNAFLNPNVEGDPFTGGLESIDPDTYVNTLLIDDGTLASNRGFFTDALVVSATKAYIVTPTVFPNASLLVANPFDGTVADGTVEGLTDQPISLLARDSSGRIWVGLGGNQPGLRFLDPDTDSISADIIRTDLVPLDIAFTD